MLLTELEKGQDVKLYIVVSDQTMEFDSTVTGILSKKGLVYFTPVIRNNKILSFNAKGVSANIVVTFPDSKPIIFQNLTFQTLKNDDGSFCYGVTAASEGVEFNRRGAFRCYVDISSVLSMGLEKKGSRIIIRDVSASGFSFVYTSSDKSCEVGAFVHTLMEDYLEPIKENFSFQLSGVVVREQELENGRLVYGCKLVNKVPGLEAYIAKKERVRIHKQRGN